MNKSMVKRPFLKVCGLTHASSLDCAIAFGAEYVGFRFYPGDIRSISAWQASKMPSGNAVRVGVFPSENAGHILTIVKDAALDMVQVEAMAGTEWVRHIESSRVVCSLRCGEGLSAEVLQRLRDDWQDICSLYRVELGSQSDAELLKKLRFPHPWMLAGAIDALNVELLVHSLSPDGVEVDVSIEQFPGLKDMQSLLKIGSAMPLRC